MFKRERFAREKIKGKETKGGKKVDSQVINRKRTWDSEEIVGERGIVQRCKKGGGCWGKKKTKKN